MVCICSQTITVGFTDSAPLLDGPWCESSTHLDFPYQFISRTSGLSHVLTWGKLAEMSRIPVVMLKTNPHACPERSQILGIF